MKFKFICYKAFIKVT